MNTIAERLKELRKEKRMTQAELGEKLGATKQAIASIEAGNNNPSIKLISKLILDLNINSNWLIAGIGDMFINTSDELSPEMEKAFDAFLKKKGLL